jgi:hypothetical protein
MQEAVKKIEKGHAFFLLQHRSIRVKARRVRISWSCGGSCTCYIPPVSKLAVGQSIYGRAYPHMQSIVLASMRSMHEAGILVVSMRVRSIRRILRTDRR